MNTARNHYDLVIVGAGIVGASFAALLAENADTASLSIAIIDAAEEHSVSEQLGRLSEQVFDPRVVALSGASRDILERAGVWPKIIAKRACPYHRMQVWDADGTGNISFGSGEGSSTETLGHICENSVVVAALHDKLKHARSKLSLIFGQALTDIRAEVGSYVLELANGEELMAKLVVGADGAHSKLRSLAGMPTREWDYHQAAIISTVKTEKPHNFCARQRFSKQGPLAFLPLHTKHLGAGHSAPQELSNGSVEQNYCSIVWSVETKYAERLMSLSDESFCAELGRAIELSLGEVLSVDKRHLVSLRQRFASAYVKPALALVGDAAHTIHPLAGQGVNLGLYDVQVLAEELQRACRQQIPISEASLLKRYERRRQPHNLLTMASMEAFKRGFSSDDLAVRCLRNFGLNLVDRHSFIKRVFSQFASGNFRNVG